MSPRVSVVIVNLNGRAMLGDCLRSLWRQEYQDFEVVVVDNGSTDGSMEFLGSLSDRRLRTVALRVNRGFAAGCNAGIHAATGEYIATLNNDAQAEPGWLEALVAVLDEDSHTGMCASKILFAGDRRRIDKVGHLIYMDGLNHGRGSGEVDTGQFDRVEEVLFPDAAAALYRREMLDQIGLFDELFFAYGDDADLGLRGRIAGWMCIYVPTALVYHIHSATAGEFSALKAFLIERNRIWVAIKLFPLPLLCVSPFFTALRFLFHAYGALFSTWVVRTICRPVFAMDPDSDDSQSLLVRDQAGPSDVAVEASDRWLCPVGKPGVCSLVVETSNLSQGVDPRVLKTYSTFLMVVECRRR